MKITTTRVIQELEAMGHLFIDKLIVKDVIKIIDQKLKEQKGISIRK